MNFIDAIRFVVVKDKNEARFCENVYALFSNLAQIFALYCVLWRSLPFFGKESYLIVFFDLYDVFLYLSYRYAFS